MGKISSSVKNLLGKQHFVIVASLNKSGTIHTSAKGVVDVDPKGKIFILDVYKAKTYKNVKNNPHVTLTSIDEKNYRGYSIRGRASIIKEDKLPKDKLKIWHDKVSKRIAKRIIRHVRGESSGHEGIPEADFPLPQYIIEVSVEAVIDLAPRPRR